MARDSIDTIDTLFGELRSRLQHGATGDGWRALLRIVARAWVVDAPQVRRAWVPYLCEHLASWPDTLRTLDEDGPLAGVAQIPGGESLAPLVRRLVIRGQAQAHHWMRPAWTRGLAELELEGVTWAEEFGEALVGAERLRRLTLRELEGPEGAIEAMEQWEGVRGLAHLAWSATTLESELFARMTRLELTGLVELDLRAQKTLEVAHLEALREAPMLASLQRLVLREAWLGPGVLSALEDAPWLEDLEIDTTGYSLSFQFHIQLT